MSELDELIKKLEEIAEHTEREVLYVCIQDPNIDNGYKVSCFPVQSYAHIQNPDIYKALAAILKMLRELQSQLSGYYTYTGH